MSRRKREGRESKANMKANRKQTSFTFNYLNSLSLERQRHAGRERGVCVWGGGGGRQKAREGEREDR